MHGKRSSLRKAWTTVSSTSRTRTWRDGRRVASVSPEDLPDMLDMVLQDADTRQDFATGNMMLKAKLNAAARHWAVARW